MHVHDSYWHTHPNLHHADLREVAERAVPFVEGVATQRAGGLEVSVNTLCWLGTGRQCVFYSYLRGALGCHRVRADVSPVVSVDIHA